MKKLVELRADIDVSGHSAPTIAEMRSGLAQLLKVAPAAARVAVERYQYATGGQYHRLIARWSQYV